MALNPIAAGLRNPTKSNIKVQLSIPAGASLDDVADQLLAAGLREAPETPSDEAPAGDGQSEGSPKPKRSRRGDG